MPKVFPVIMCGGSGTRLWPASRPSRPKQFISLVGSNTLFEQTIDRVCGIAEIDEIIIVAGARHADWVTSQVCRANVPTMMLLEPDGRDSAPAIAAAVAYVEKIDPTGVLVIVASDHYIPNSEAFCNDIDIAVQNACEGGIVSLGIAPTEPSPAYGYIQPDSFKGSIGSVCDFHEKPNQEKAVEYIAQGYLWNSGNFISRADTLANAFEATAADVLAAARQGLEAGEAVEGGLVLGNPFIAAPKISFDYAVMEKFDHRKVVRSATAWSDLGAWDAVHQAMVQDKQGNSSVGDAVFVDANNCHIRVAAGQTVVAAAVDGLNIVAEDDVLLVTRLDRSQVVKKVVEVLKESYSGKVDAPKVTFDTAAVAKSWRRWLDTAVLPLWWTNGYDHEVGIFRESLTLDAARPTDVSVRARVQGRQAYVYARAGAAGWPGPWQEATRSGLGAAKSHYCSENALLHTKVGNDGSHRAIDYRLYDQTFILLALCHARTELEDAEARALEHLDAIEKYFHRTDQGQGFREMGDHPFQSNAHMHLLESAIAWVEANGDERWSSLANEIANFAADDLIGAEDGLLREFYNSDWSQADGKDGRILDPGHQFEWASLLKRWSLLTGSDKFATIAIELFNVGLAGVDRDRGVVLLQMDDEFKPLSGIARLWSQTEWLKAAAALAADATTDEEAFFYHCNVDKAAQALDRFIDTSVTGLWYDKMTEDGRFVEEDVPASSLYHIVGAVEALEENVALRTGAA